MKYIYLWLLSMLSIQTVTAGKGYQEKEVTYYSGDVLCKGWLVIPQGLIKPAPAVIIVHEWWGLNEYPKQRARMLADLGYVAFCADMYGNGQTASNPQEAMKLSGMIYNDPEMLRSNFEASLNQVRSMPMVDSKKIAAIGYCFGGTVVLNAVKMGAELNGVVSFHGGLKGPVPNKPYMKAKILVCHGGADPFVPEADVKTFKRELDSIDYKYEFITYPGATHAFTNQESDNNAKKFGMPIKYNPEADLKSWADMKKFLRSVLGS